MKIASNVQSFDISKESDYTFSLFAKRVQELAATFYASKDNMKDYEEWAKKEGVI